MSLLLVLVLLQHGDVAGILTTLGLSSIHAENRCHSGSCVRYCTSLRLSSLGSNFCLLAQSLALVF
jgi:hypothetical protein